MRATPAQLDPRGPRFAAALTAAVVATVLVTGSAWLLAVQVVVFAIGAFAGPAAAPYGRVYAWMIRPRLGPPRHLEDATPPRFAQAVGLAFAAAGLVGLVAGADPVTYVALGGALAAAFLNAVFGFCLGCEIYLAYRRLTSSRQSTPSPNTITEVAP